MRLFAWPSEPTSAVAVAMSLAVICGCDNAPRANSPPPVKVAPAGSFASPGSAEQAKNPEQPGDAAPARTEPEGSSKQNEPPQAGTSVQLDIANWEETQAIIA